MTTFKFTLLGETKHKWPQRKIVILYDYKRLNIMQCLVFSDGNRDNYMKVEPWVLLEILKKRKTDREIPKHILDRLRQIVVAREI